MRAPPTKRSIRWLMRIKERCFFELPKFMLVKPLLEIACVSKYFFTESSLILNFCNIFLMFRHINKNETSMSTKEIQSRRKFVATSTAATASAELLVSQ